MEQLDSINFLYSLSGLIVGVLIGMTGIGGGSLISWAVFREGTAERWVKRDLETLLAPYREARGVRSD